jgi:hypothetical protein
MVSQNDDLPYEACRNLVSCWGRNPDRWPHPCWRSGAAVLGEGNLDARLPCEKTCGVLASWAEDVESSYREVEDETSLLSLSSALLPGEVLSEGSSRLACLIANCFAASKAGVFRTKVVARIRVNGITFLFFECLVVASRSYGTCMWTG